MSNFKLGYSVNQLGEDAKARYAKKLEACGLKECPYLLPEDSWIDEPKSSPHLEYPDVYDYLINTPGIFTKEAMKNRKSLQAHQYFTSGFVRTIYLLKSQQSDISILKAKVLPSQKVMNEEYLPWLAVQRNGYVLTGHCNCMAGLGESCSHIAAVLFKIEAAVRGGYTKSVCTDEACKWNNDFVQKVQPAPVANISFFTEKAAAKTNPSKHVRSASHTSRPILSDNDLFLEKLAKLQKPPVVLSSYDKYSNSFIPTQSVPIRVKLPDGLRSLYSVQNSGKTREELANLILETFPKISLNSQEVAYIESLTKKQSACALWFEMRAGRITASVAHDVLHTSIEHPSESLILRICSSQKNSNSNVPSLRWGIDNEKNAIREFYCTASKIHSGLKINSSGLKFGGKNCFLAASPDSIVTCDCHPCSLLEVKCPFKSRDSLSMHNAIKERGNEFCLDSFGNLKRCHRYYTQVQIQMYVFGVDICHFVIWTPKWQHSLIIMKDASFISKVLAPLEDFYCSHILPEVLSRKLENRVTPLAPVENTSELFCYCQQPDTGSRAMIGCDSATCKRKWFHLSCAKISKIPKGNWYCYECKSSKRKKF